MTDKNLAIWNRLSRTDPAHTKGFKRAGGFSGTAIKPIYTVQKMTEQFGPAGLGWGMGEPTFQVVPGVNNEVLVYCHVSLWWRPSIDPELAPVAVVWGVGGDKIVSHIKANEQFKRPERWENDDEAFKKAFTDAVGNAMKHLGMSADVHMGLFDDSKYVNELRNEIAAQAHEEEPKQIATLPKAKARDMYAEMQAEIDACESLEQLAALWTSKAFQDEFKKQPIDWQDHLTERKDLLKAELSAAPAKPRVAPNFEGMPA